MSEVIRDLYVQLTLNSGSFAQDIKGAQEQVKQAEARFKEAGAGVKGFEKTIAGMQAKVQMARDKIAAQNAVVEKSTSAHEAAKKKVQDAIDRQAKLAKSVEAAKAAYNASVTATGKNSEETQNLAKELEKVSGQYKATEKSIPRYAQEVEHSETAMINAKAAMKGMEVELRAAEATLRKNGTWWGQARKQVEEYNTAAGKVGGKLTAIGGKMTRNITVPIVAAAAASYKAWDTMDEGLDTVIRKTGATGAALVPLEKAYNNVFLGIKTTAEDAGIAVGGVSTRFKLQGKELENMSKLFIQFADANETDLSGSIENTGKILAQWKQPASAAAGFLGLITSEAHRTGISVDTLMESIQTNGAMLKAMGLNLSQSVQMMANFEAAGVNADTALAALKKSAATYAKDGVSLEQGLAATVKAIQGAATEIDALAIAQKVFGAKGALEMSTAIREGRLSVTGMTADMSKMGDVVSKTFNEINGDTPLLDRAKNKVVAAAATMGKSLITWVEPAADFVGKLADNFAAIDPAARNNIVTFGLLAAATGPVLTGLGNVITASGTIAKFMTGPAGWVTLAIAAVAGLAIAFGSVKTKAQLMEEQLKKIKVNVNDEDVQQLKTDMQAGIDAANQLNQIKITIKGDTTKLSEAIEKVFADDKFTSSEKRFLANTLTKTVSPDIDAARLALKSMTGEAKTETEALLAQYDGAYGDFTSLLNKIYAEKRTPTEAEIAKLNEYLAQIGDIRAQLQAANVEAIAAAQAQYNLVVAGRGDEKSTAAALGLVKGNQDQAIANAEATRTTELAAAAGDLDKAAAANDKYTASVEDANAAALVGYKAILDGASRAAGAATDLGRIADVYDEIAAAQDALNASTQQTGWTDRLKTLTDTLNNATFSKYLSDAEKTTVGRITSNVNNGTIVPYYDYKNASDILGRIQKDLQNEAEKISKDPKLSPVTAIYQTLLDSGAIGELDLSTLDGALEGIIKLSEFPKLMEENGTDAVNGLSSGITAGTSTATTAVHDVFQAAIEEANRMRPKLQAAMQVLSGGGGTTGGASGGLGGYQMGPRSFSANLNVQNLNVNSQADIDVMMANLSRLQNQRASSYGRTQNL